MESVAPPGRQEGRHLARHGTLLRAARWMSEMEPSGARWTGAKRRAWRVRPDGGIKCSRQRPPACPHPSSRWGAGETDERRVGQGVTQVVLPCTNHSMFPVVRCAGTLVFRVPLQEESTFRPTLSASIPVLSPRFSGGAYGGRCRGIRRCRR